MTINTTNINGFVVLPNDTVRERSHLTFTLIGFDTDEDDRAVVVPFPIDVPIAPDGSIDVDLWPNPEGVRNTLYGVTAYLHNGVRPATVPLGRISVPVSGGPFDLNDLLPVAPPSGANVDDYIAYLAAAVSSAESAASDASASADSILSLTASASSVPYTNPATATYDPVSGNIEFDIPKGEPGAGIGAIPTQRIVGRQTAGTGMAEYLTATQARSVMGLGTAATTDATAYAPASQGRDEATVTQIRNLTSANAVTPAQVKDAVNLTAPPGDADWTPDWGTFVSAKWVMTGGNKTLNNPTNVIPGTTRSITLTSGDTSRTIAWGTAYKGDLPDVDVDSSSFMTLFLYAVSATEILVSGVEWS